MITLGNWAQEFRLEPKYFWGRFLLEIFFYQEPKVVDLTTEERTRATQYKVKYKGHRIMENGADRLQHQNCHKII